MAFLRTAVLLVGGGLLIGACGARTDTSDLFPRDGVGGTPGSGDCCSAHPGTGCDDASIEACVCDYDSSCCTDRWDGTCALIVPLADCGSCSDGTGGMPSVGGRPSSGGRSGTGGSAVGGQFRTGGAPSIGGVASTGGRDTGGAWSSGGQGTGGSTSECCVPRAPGDSGCSEPAVERCVCQNDPFCCEEYWDGQCVQDAQTCGFCGGGVGGQGAGGQGIGGQGVGGQGIGGQGVGGQGVGGQGVGGAFVQVCSAVLGAGCGDCLCQTCTDEIASCLNDIGCWNIFVCAAQTGCTGVDCYQESTCKYYIDALPGSLPGALGMLACADKSGCGCL